MYILSALLAISLFTLSAAKTAQLFILSDQKLTKIQVKFKKSSQALLQKENQIKGNISLFFALLTLILSGLLLFYLLKMKMEYAEALYRKESYLCAHYLNHLTEKYIKEMAIYNGSIKAAFLLVQANPTQGHLLLAFKGLVFIRNGRHFNYIKKLSFNNYCSKLEASSYLKNLPFKTAPGFKLITLIDQTSIVRQNKWTTSTYKFPKKIRLSKSFCLNTVFQIENAFLPHLKFKTEEIPMMELSKSKCFYGS